MDVPTTEALITGVSVVFSGVAGVLRRNGYPAPVNEGITGGLITAAAVGLTFAGGHITGNLALDLSAIAAQVTAIMLGPGKILEQALQPRVNVGPKASSLSKRTTSVVPTVQTWNTGKQDTSG